MNLTLTFVNYELLKDILFNSWSIWIFYELIFFKVVYSSENEPVLIIFCFSNSTYRFFLIIWQEIVLTHKKGDLELVKEQQFFIESHIILIILGK